MKYLLNNETYYYDDGGYDEELASGDYTWTADDVDCTGHPHYNRKYYVLYIAEDGEQIVYIGLWKDFKKSVNKDDIMYVEVVFAPTKVHTIKKEEKQ